MFHSCDDLTHLSMLGTHSSPERLVSDLEQTLNALKRLPLSPDVALASSRVAEDVEELAAVLEGVRTTKASTSVATKEMAQGSQSYDVRSDTTKSSTCVATKDMTQGSQSYDVIKAEAAPQHRAMAPAMNELILVLWPRIGKYVQDLICNSIEPSINDSLPGMLRGGVKFTHVSLGQSSPCIGPFQVEHDEHNGAIEFHVGIDFFSDLDIKLTAMSVPIGITKLHVKGDLVLLLSPPMDQPPFFGGVQVYFPNPPDIGLNFVGAARVADIPGLRGAIRGTIDSAVAGVCVLPRRIAMDMNEDDDVDIIDLTYPEPTGILRFTLYSGSSLIASDSHLFGAATSDPYVVIALGVESWRSPTITKNLDPVWGDGQGLTVDFPVHDHDQCISIKVFDEDFASADDLIGIAKRVKIKDLVQAPQCKQVMELFQQNGEPGAGNLTVSVRLHSLTMDRPSVALPAPSEAHLSVKIRSVKGLRLGAEFPFKVRVQVRHSEDNRGARKSNSNDLVENKKNTKPILQRSNSTLTKEGICAESVTKDSAPKEQKQLGEALQGIATKLAQKGNPADEIANILDVELPLVEHFLESLDETQDKSKAKDMEQAAAQRKPCFDEVLQMLLPIGTCDQFNWVELAVLDKRKKAIATAKIPMSQILAADGFHVNGPFQTDDKDVKIKGDLHLRWLI
jgi:hypothetical protein